MEGIHIALAAEKITEIWGIPITNTLITTWVVMALLVGISLIVRYRLALVPSKVQTLFETGVTEAVSYMESLFESRKLALLFLPLIATLFLFILFSNILEFVPGVGSIGFFHGEEFTPLFRSVNTDFNSTLALAFIVFLIIEISGVIHLGFLKYLGKFVNLKSGIGFAVGIIDLFSELARLVSFSFRLFGNIFAGEVMLAVVMAFVPLFLPIPFMAFEMFVGFIQAAIFALLTLFFIKIAMSEHH